MTAFLVPAAANGGGGLSGPILYVMIAFFVIVFGVSLLRLRRGGPGPAVNYVPRRLRGNLNSAYRRAGWQEPFDSSGNRNPDRSQT